MKVDRRRPRKRRSQPIQKVSRANGSSTEFVLKTRDCILGMRDLLPESVDIVVTSPPYNLGIKYTNYNDSRNRDVSSNAGLPTYRF
jgi:DNA modification methylase